MRGLHIDVITSILESTVTLENPHWVVHRRASECVRHTQRAGSATHTVGGGVGGSRCVRLKGRLWIRISPRHLSHVRWKKMRVRERERFCSLTEIQANWMQVKICTCSPAWLSHLKGYCDWTRTECVLDVCGKRRQKGAQMEERQRNDQINKQIHSTQLLRADIIWNTFSIKCL